MSVPLPEPTNVNTFSEMIYNVALLLLGFLLSICISFRLETSRCISRKQQINHDSLQLISQQKHGQTFVPRFIHLPRKLSSSDDVEGEYGMPEKKDFEAYYDSVVKKGEEINKLQFMAYKAIVSLIDKGQLYGDDLDDLWLSATGDASGLNREEAYEMLCMVHDLPDPEDIKFYDDAFEELSGGSGVLGYQKFIVWKDIKDMLDAEVMELEDVAEIWKEVAGDLDAQISRDVFGKLNKALDDAIDEMEDGLFGLDDIETDEAIFAGLSGGKDSLTCQEFTKWDDIQFLIDSEVVDKNKITQIWREVAGDLEAAVSLEVFIEINTVLDDLLDSMEDEFDDVTEV